IESPQIASWSPFFNTSPAGCGASLGSNFAKYGSLGFGGLSALSAACAVVCDAMGQAATHNTIETVREILVRFIKECRASSAKPRGTEGKSRGQRRGGRNSTHAPHFGGTFWTVP